MQTGPTTVSMRANALLVAVAVGLLGHAPAAQSGDVSLAVAGRPNSTPSIAARGGFVAVAWGAAADGKADIYSAVSRDGGRTFGAPVRVNSVAGEGRLGGELPPRVALTPAGTGDPHITVLWTARGTATSLKAARSRDGGRTFGVPTPIGTAEAPGDRGWPAVATDDGGAVHAIWLDHRGLGAKPGESREKGSQRHTGPHDGVAMAQRSALYYAGIQPQTAERALTPGVCYCCKTALAGGPNGLMVAAWRHVFPGNQRDIALSVSHDRGRSFTDPVRVSPDNWEIDGCPDDGPAVAVDTGGTVHLVWPTVIGGPTPQGALFYASSRDGRTFTPRLRVPTRGSPRPMHPQIALGPGGRVFVAWDELIDGRRMASVRELHGGGRHGQWGDLVLLSEAEPGTYPVLAGAADGLLAAWTAGRSGETVIKVRRVTPSPQR